MKVMITIPCFLFLLFKNTTYSSYSSSSYSWRSPIYTADASSSTPKQQHARIKWFTLLLQQKQQHRHYHHSACFIPPLFVISRGGGGDYKDYETQNTTTTISSDTTTSNISQHDNNNNNNNNNAVKIHETKQFTKEEFKTRQEEPILQNEDHNQVISSNYLTKQQQTENDASFSIIQEQNNAVPKKNHNNNNNNNNNNTLKKASSSSPSTTTTKQNLHLLLLQNKLHTLTTSLLTSSQLRLSQLEEKQNDVFMNLETKMPILEFGSEANLILEEILERFREFEKDWKEEKEKELIWTKQEEVLKIIAGNSGIRRLYYQQLQSLREYYGRRYESILDDEELWNNVLQNFLQEKGGGMEEEEEEETQRKQLKQKRQDIITNAASRSTDGFRVAAMNAIPKLCRTPDGDVGGGGDDDDVVVVSGEEEKKNTRITQLLYNVDGGYEYTSILHGLVQDMMEATSLRESLEDDDDEWEEDANNNEEKENQTHGGGGGVGTKNQTNNKKQQRFLWRVLRFKRKKRSGPMKWYEKVAAKVLVLGVNYLQGWLALQGIRRAAAERDENMPKFPLF